VIADGLEPLDRGHMRPGTSQMQAILHGYVPPGITSVHELGMEGATEMRIRMDDNKADRANIVILVKDSPGASTLRSPVFLKRVCLHELGHALAMHGHSPNRHDVMFPSAVLDGEAKLSERDKNTIRRIYQQ
jgi:hypothetical protein